MQGVDDDKGYHPYTYKSAIKDLYTEQRLAMKEELNRELIDLSNCYSCVVAKKKKRGRYGIQGG